MGTLEVYKTAKDEGYLALKTLDTGEFAAVVPQLFTFALIVFDEHTIRKRWCFERKDEAFMSIEEWEGVGDPPGNWIKQKLPVERMNPNWSNREGEG